MMKTIRRLLAVAVCAMIPGAVHAAELDVGEILKRLQTLENQVREQQAVIEELKSQLTEKQQPVSDEQVSQMVKEEVGAAVRQGLAQVKDTPLVKLGKGIDSLTLTGDLRARWETRDLEMRNAADTSRDRMRTRFRLGLVWNNPDGNWEVGAGLATGEAIDSNGDGNADTGAAGATSANDTWSAGSPFETGEMFLDYAYAKHSWDKAAVVLGQQKSPFKGSWLLLDSDIRPAGLTAAYAADGLFAGAGVYDVQQRGNNMGGLYATQVGYTIEGEGMDVLVAAGYFHFNGNANKVLGRPNTKYEWHIGDLYAEAAVPVGDAKVKLYGDLFKNFGADGDAGQGQQGGNLEPEDEDVGWLLGLDMKLGAFSAGYAYAYVEADSCHMALKDQDFGAVAGMNNTDVKGHSVKLGYKLTDNCSVGATARFVRAIELDSQGRGDLYQLDVKYKF